MSVNTTIVDDELKAKSDATSSLDSHMASLVSICIKRKEYELIENEQGKLCLKIDAIQLKRGRFYLPLYQNSSVTAASEQSEQSKPVMKQVHVCNSAEVLDLKELKETTEGFQNQPINTIKDIKLKILELLNLNYVKQDFFNNHKKDTNFILKTFFPNLYIAMSESNLKLHPDVLLQFLGNSEAAIMYSIKVLNELLEIVGDKTKSADEIVSVFYDRLIESRNIILKEKEKILKKLIDKAPIPLVKPMKRDCGVVHQAIIDLINNIIPLMENVVPEQQKVFWQYTDSVECTLPGTPYGRHVKLSAYSMELKSFYDAFMDRIDTEKKQRTHIPEKLGILAIAKLEANAVIEELNALSHARAQKILGTSPLKGTLKVSSKHRLAHESIFVERDETQKTFYKAYEIFERLRSISTELDLSLTVVDILFPILKPSPKHIEAVPVSNHSGLDHNQQQVLSVDKTVKPSFNQSEVSVVADKAPSTPKAYLAHDQKQSIEHFKIEQQKTIENYRRQVAEARRQKEEEKLKLSKNLQSEAKVHLASVKRLRTNMAQLNPDELDCTLGVLENRKELDHNLTEKVLIKVGFKSSETSAGTKYKFGEHSFSVHRMQAARLKSGMAEIPRDAIRDLRGIFWELGITKQTILFMQQKLQKRRTSLDKRAF